MLPLAVDVGNKRKMDTGIVGESEGSVGSARVPGLELTLTDEEAALFALLMEARALPSQDSVSTRINLLGLQDQPSHLSGNFPCSSSATMI